MNSQKTATRNKETRAGYFVLFMAVKWTVLMDQSWKNSIGSLSEEYFNEVWWLNAIIINFINFYKEQRKTIKENNMVPV